MKLYEITADHQKALATLEQMDELTQEDIQDSMSAITATFEEKAISVGAFIKNLEAEGVAIKAAENNMEAAKRNMAARRTFLENKIDRIKTYLLKNMESTRVTAIKCPEFEVKLKKCPPSLDIINEGLLPEEYFTVTYKASKALAKEGLAKGDKRLSACVRVIDDKYRVEIK